MNSNCSASNHKAHKEGTKITKTVKKIKSFACFVISSFSLALRLVGWGEKAEWLISYDEQQII